MELLLPLLGLLTLADGKHLLRFLTFCQSPNSTADAQYDIEFDADQLLYVFPDRPYHVVQRLPEFAEQWTPDPGLPEDTYVSVGTCLYNYPHAIRGEKNPPDVIAPPTAYVFPQHEPELGVPNVLVCSLSGFHPPKVLLTWRRNEQPLEPNASSQTQYYSNKDFSFRLSSYLSFTPEQGDVYSCSVDHAGLELPLTRFWEMETLTVDETAETALCAAGVTLGLMGVSTGICLVLKAKRSYQA